MAFLFILLVLLVVTGASRESLPKYQVKYRDGVHDDWSCMFEDHFDTTTTGMVTTGSTTTSTTLPPTPGTNFCQDLSNGIYPHPTNCKLFYQCSNGITNVVECSDGTLFDPDMGNCNWDWAVNTDHCAPTTTEELSSTTTKEG